MIYHVCEGCRKRVKDRSYSLPRGWRSRATPTGMRLFCPECQEKLKSASGA
ncbi:MAG: hypothetical protein ACLFUZ_02220 [Candidatus Micrarchaeia archaeon]